MVGTVMCVDVFIPRSCLPFSLQSNGVVLMVRVCVGVGGYDTDQEPLARLTVLFPRLCGWGESLSWGFTFLAG